MAERPEAGGTVLHTPDVTKLLEGNIPAQYMLKATMVTGITAACHVHKLTHGNEEEQELSKEEKNRRTIIIDTAADTAFKGVINRAPVTFIGLDAEGGKEAHADKLGQAMPLATGKFGQGGDEYCFTVDVVEGTGAATHGRPNAMSVVGVSTKDGIKKIPNATDGKTASYFRTLFAPGAFSNLVSLERPIQENLERIATGADIPPRDITAVVMDRRCNTHLIHDIKEFGAKLEIISAGNLAWCLRAIDSDPNKPLLVLGRGGAEEGVIAAVAAKSRWATGQLRLVNERNDVETDSDGQIWTADEFVPGDVSKSFVILSAITRNDHFSLSPVTPSDNNPNRYFVDSMIVSSSGFRKVRYSMVELPQEPAAE